MMQPVPFLLGVANSEGIWRANNYITQVMVGGYRGGGGVALLSSNLVSVFGGWNLLEENIFMWKKYVEKKKDKVN